MRLNFEVKIDGQWIAAPSAIILADGRLGSKAGLVRPPYWRHAEATTRDPLFREMCFSNLTAEERDWAVSRIGKPDF